MACIHVPPPPPPLFLKSKKNISHYLSSTNNEDFLGKCIGNESFSYEIHLIHRLVTTSSPFPLIFSNLKIVPFSVYKCL